MTSKKELLEKMVKEIPSDEIINFINEVFGIENCLKKMTDMSAEDFKDYIETLNKLVINMVKISLKVADFKTASLVSLIMISFCSGSIIHTEYCQKSITLLSEIKDKYKQYDLTKDDGFADLIKETNIDKK